MGFFTMEHSQAEYRADFALCGAAVVALAAFLLAARAARAAAGARGLRGGGTGELDRHREAAQALSCAPPPHHRAIGLLRSD